MKKVVIAIICFILVVAVALSILLGLGIAGRLPNGFGGLTQNNKLEMVQRTVWQGDEITALDVFYFSDTITILPSSGNEIVLEEYMEEPTEAYLATTQQQSGRLTITQGERPVFGLFWSSYVYLYLPEKWEKQLRIENGSGSILTQQNWAFENVFLASVSGRIEAEGIRSQQDIVLQATSGRIETGPLTAKGKVQGTNSSGSIQLGEVQADSLLLKGTSGRIECLGASVEKDVLISNISGSINVGQLQGETIKMSGSSGGIAAKELQGKQVEIKNTSGRIQVDRLEGIFRIENSSGSIQVGSANGEGWAKSISSGIHLKMEEVTGDVQLEASSGSIDLTLPESSFTITLASVSGGIRTNFDSQLQFSNTGTSAKGTVGNPPSFAVSCKNISGSIRVQMGKET